MLAFICVLKFIFRNRYIRCKCKSLWKLLICTFSIFFIYNLFTCIFKLFNTRFIVFIFFFIRINIFFIEFIYKFL